MARGFMNRPSLSPLLRRRVPVAGRLDWVAFWRRNPSDAQATLKERHGGPSAELRQPGSSRSLTEVRIISIENRGRMKKDGLGSIGRGFIALSRLPIG